MGLFLRLKNFNLYFKTARHLTARQVYFQLRYRFFPRTGTWMQNPRCHCKRLVARVPFLARRVAPESDFLSHRHTFLNRTACTAHRDGTDVDWEYSECGGLWLDNLHYLRGWDALDADHVSLKGEVLLNWLSSWAKHVGTHRGSKALNPPYNASERAFILGRFLLRHGSILSKSLSDLLEIVIGRDLNYVANTLEYHLDGNHLLKNLMSLAWGVCLFEGPDAARWKRIIDAELTRTFQTQILDDGMHYERSPMYHNIALLDLLDIVNVAPESPWRNDLLVLARKMIAASLAVTHPDGDIAQFNDAAFDPCPRSVDIIAYGIALCGAVIRPPALPAAGYYLLACDERYYVIADAGPLGPDEQMGHAHSDIFAFEMSLFGHRIFVNGGTSTYYDQPFREHERSERAHNTLAFNRHGQCQHWSYFRAAERTHPEAISWKMTSQGTLLSGAIELVGPAPRPIHRRTFKFTHPGELQIVDEVWNADHQKVSNRLHLAPEVVIKTIEPECGMVWLLVPGGYVLQVSFSGAHVSVENCLISRKFNERVETRVLVFSLKNGTLPEFRSMLEIKLLAIPLSKEQTRPAADPEFDRLIASQFNAINYEQFKPSGTGEKLAVAAIGMGGQQSVNQTR